MRQSTYRKKELQKKKKKKKKKEVGGGGERKKERWMDGWNESEYMLSAHAHSHTLRVQEIAPSTLPRLSQPQQKSEKRHLQSDALK